MRRSRLSIARSSTIVKITMSMTRLSSWAAAAWAMPFRADLLLPVLERNAVCRAVGQLVRFGWEVGRGAASGSQEADGALSRADERFRSSKAEGVDEADPRHRGRRVLRHRHQYAWSLYSPRPRTICTMSTRGRSLGPIRALSLATPSSTTSILRNDAEPLTARLPPSGDRNRTRAA